jgi:hypothetical protein
MYKNERNNLPCKCKARGHKMAAGSTERTSGYFGDQTPSESNKPCFPFRIRFYHFSRTPLSQPLLDQSDQSARFYFTPIATPFRNL